MSEKRKGIEALRWRYLWIVLVVILISTAIFVLSVQSMHRELRPNLIEPNRMLTKLVMNKLIPGHPAYIVFMVRDRVQLATTTDPISRVELLRALADRRYRSAVELYSMDEKEFGISTLNKAIIYLSRAVSETHLLVDSTAKLHQYRLIRDDIERYSAELYQRGRALPDPERSRLDSMIQLLLLMHEGLTGHINQNSDN